MRVIVVGGGAAGMSCASLVKRRRPETDVTVLERGHHVSFSACGIPYWLGGRVEGGPESLVVLDAETARRERDIDVRTRTRVLDVDADASTVTAEEDGARSELAYDRLVLATGVEPVDPFDARDADNVLAFRHLDDGVRARRLLDEEAPETACVVGGGFVGIETAEALNRLDVETTLVQREDTLLGGRLARGISEPLEERIREEGIDLRTGAPAEDVVIEDGRARAVELPGGEVPADVVVVAVGTRPRTALAEAAGCSIHDSGGVFADRAMRTDVENVLACGDGVAYEHRLTGERVVQPLALHANRSGRIAGQTIVGEEAGFPGVLGTAVSSFEEMEVSLTGLTREEAQRAGHEAVSHTIESVTRAGYFPGAEDVQVHLVAEEDGGRLLGGQIVGGPGAGKRIDTVAAAIWMGATCEDVEAMDLAYTPPVSPTWDPVAIAARMTARETGGAGA